MIRTRATRRAATAVLATVLIGGVLAACSSTSNNSSGSGGGGNGGGGGSASNSGGGQIKSGLKVYFIPKDTQNPYEVLADKGGQKALSQLGGSVVVNSGTQDTASAQIPAIQAATQAHANAIVIAANDPKALCPSLNTAARQGIKILAFDSDIECGNSPTHLFINQADTAVIGKSEVDLLAKEINSQGQIAILSAAASATNQNAWIKYMKDELKKYPKMKLVKIVYGNDDPATSLTVLQGLLSAYPNLKGIISPTTVGISTAAQYLDTHPSVRKQITLTGLGLPSEMRKYIKDGTVKAFELWDPSHLGYLAGYAAASLASGTALQAGATFQSGDLHKTYTIKKGNGEYYVILGPPTLFTKANIDKYHF